MSTKTGTKPFCSTVAMSETQVSVGTITSPPSGWRIFSTAIESRFADAPALTKTECFTPSHFDHSASKAAHCGPLVRIGSSPCRWAMTASRSSRRMLLRIRGYLAMSLLGSSYFSP